MQNELLVIEDGVFEGELLIPPAVVDVEKAAQMYSQIVQFVRKVMTSDVDYGVIPGTGKKPSLWQPGAQKMIRVLFGYRPEFEVIKEIEQWDVPVTETTYPVFYYHYRCILKDQNGNIVATAEGSANSMEDRYRNRWMPPHEVPSNWDKDKLEHRVGTWEEFSFAVDKAETTGKYGKPAEYWQKFKDAIADKSAVYSTKSVRGGDMKPTVKVIAEEYCVPNRGIYNEVNTILKIAMKRALVAAALVGCAASEFFSQDLEDFQDRMDDSSKGVYGFVPPVNDAKKVLLNYGKQKDLSGQEILTALTNAGMKFTLDAWEDMLLVVDKAAREKAETNSANAGEKDGIDPQST